MQCIRISFPGASNSLYAWTSTYAYFIAITNMIFLVIYLWVLREVIYRLYHLYHSFYISGKKRILLTNGLLIIALLSRAIFEILETSTTIKRNLSFSFYNNTWFYSLYTFTSLFLTMFLPVSVVLYTLKLSMKKRNND